MAVYKNKYNLWSVQGKYKDGTGNYKNYHRFKDKNGFRLKKEAVEADLKLRRELSEVGRYVPAHQLTFKGLCDEYLNEKKRILKYSTIYADTKILKRADAMNELLLKEVMPKTIQQIIDDMDKEGLSLNYIGRFSDTLNKIFKFAVDKEYMARNPMDKVIRIKRPNVVQKKDMNFWEPQDFKKFIENVDDTVYHAYFTFAYFMGCRRGEMLALQWKDIDFDKATCNIYKTCNQTPEDGSLYQLTPPKTNNSVRLIKIPNIVLEELRRLYERASNMYYFSNDWFVFGSNVPLAEATLQRNFKRYLTSDLKPITIHGFRHSHVSFLINNGANIKAIASRVGDTVDQVLKTYSHLFQKTEDELISLIEINQ